LRPSIETLLHGLMPHAIVVHLHAVDVLAHLVREAFPASLEERLGPETGWIAVPYRKPGAELAQAIADGLAQNPQADIVMMQSHGVVIGGRDVAEVEDRLERLTAALAVAPRGPIGAAAPIPGPLQGAYQPVADPLLNQLSLDPVLFDRLERDWVLYPDHVVFLGPRPVRADSLDGFLADWPDRAGWPEILFLKGQGVFTASTLSDAKLAQLRCYYDVLTRQEPQERLNALTTAQIAELLNWDAEKYRMSLSR
jgi:rhamnose utilization protein RhaD (predicted bifunctional aldolase and dehydrogenase)